MDNNIQFAMASMQCGRRYQPHKYASMADEMNVIRQESAHAAGIFERRTCDFAEPKKTTSELVLPHPAVP
jgi:hypothetical protein